MPVELSTKTTSLNRTRTSISAPMVYGLTSSLSEVTDSTTGAIPSTLTPLNSPSVPRPVAGRARSAVLPSASAIVLPPGDRAPATPS